MNAKECMIEADKLLQKWNCDTTGVTIRKVEYLYG